MAELDSIPQKQSVEIETVKLDETTASKLKELNQTLQSYVINFGEIFLRRKELISELEKLESLQKTTEEQFNDKNNEFKQIVDGLDEKYPQCRINLQEGIVSYQPGAPTRKQMLESAVKK